MAQPMQPNSVTYSVNGVTGIVTVTGKTTPNAFVRSTFTDGMVAEGYADENGVFAIQTFGDVVENGSFRTVAYSDLGEASRSTTVPYKDVVIDQPVTIQQLSTDTQTGQITVEGNAAPNAQITVTFPDGQQATTVANAQGVYTVTSANDVQGDGSITVEGFNPVYKTTTQANIDYVDTFVATPISATDSQATVVVDNLQALTATTTTQCKTFVKLFGTSLLSFMGLGKFGGTFDFSVKEGHQQDLIATVKTASLGAVLDKTKITLFQQQADGSWKAISSNKDKGLFDIIIFGEQATIKVKGLGEGNYKLGFESDPFVGLINKLTVNVSHIDYDLNQVPKTNTKINDVTGNVLADAEQAGQTGKVSLSILKDGQYVEIGNNAVQVQGKHGVLEINADGSYVYKPAKNLATVIEAEEFSYKVTDASGQSATATLSIDFSYNWKGTAANDLFVSTSANDVISSGKGADTLMYKVLDDASNTAGNGHDTWTDFTVNKCDGDQIDISNLLVGYTGDKATLSQFVSISKETNSNGKIDTIISIDRDGAGSKYQAEELLTLKNVNTDLLTLLNNDQFIA